MAKGSAPRGRAAGSGAECDARRAGRMRAQGRRSSGLRAGNYAAAVVLAAAVLLAAAALGACAGLLQRVFIGIIMVWTVLAAASL